MSIRKPSATTISYGDSIILHADMNEALPSGWTVKWTADNGNFSYSANGETCTITPSKSGDTTFTATVYDENGNEISKDTQTMKSKAGFFDKFAAFFRKLFGMTKIIQQSIKF
jgi:antitoxin component YwqK of YwqJK toxin-antitoxin module